MSFKILYVTATSIEAEALKRIEGIISANGKYTKGKIGIDLLVAGIGSASTSWNLNNWLSKNKKPDLAINAGIAGSFKEDIFKGEVVMPFTDCFADAGVEDGDNFFTLFEAGLANPYEFPFTDGWLKNDTVLNVRLKETLRSVRAITVNTSTGSRNTRNKLVKKFNPDIETMEGATFFYICLREKIPFLALRAVSNKVEKRNKGNWDIELALNNLSEKVNEVFITL